MTDRSLLAAGVLAAGIAIGGGLVEWGFVRGRSADRYVEVKGLAEREATADGEYGSSGPTYVFTRLNDLKPPMIAEATANARSAAEQFARDSGSAVSGIRQANQGVFVILPRDQAPGINESSQLQKIVRVVSTVQYLLN